MSYANAEAPPGASKLVSWSTIFAGGLLLLVPTLINVTCSNVPGSEITGGRWWAPFQLWMFVAAAVGIPMSVVVLIPAVSFSALAVGVAAGRSAAVIVSRWLVVTSLFVHVTYILVEGRGAVRLHGLGYGVAVFGLGTIILALSALSIGHSSRRRDERYLILSTWFAMLWWSWLATPWLVVWI